MTSRHPLSKISAKRPPGFLGILVAFGLTSASALAGGEHGLTPYAVPVFQIGPLPVTNSMILMWAVALVILVFARIATAKMREVPQGAQNFWEFLVEGLYNFLGTILGKDLTKKTFWFFASIFIFILFNNWFGLLPGVGTVGFGYRDESGAFKLQEPLLRGGNADLNMTAAMAAIFTVLWLFWGLRENGFVGFFKHIFAPKGKFGGVMLVGMILVFFVVGLLEVISIAMRPIALSFRLYGNIFAGENLLESMTAMSAIWGWLIALPFYFLELIVGFVQALVFMLLTAIFTLLICQHEGAEEHH